MSTEELKAEITKRLDDISNDNLTRVLSQVIALQGKHKNMTERKKNIQFILVHDAKLLKRLAD
jgi:hypothetical protein